jgi:hypothetical protein
MKLVVSIDVEEEGLFSGHYAQENVAVTNVDALSVLDPVFSDLGIHPTMVATYQVLSRPEHLGALQELCARWHGELGAHLHHWNTPPIIPAPTHKPSPCDSLPEDILSEKLENLLALMRNAGEIPASFRMGRFNMTGRMFKILERTSVLADGSVAPMRKSFGGPDHLAAPVDPYFADPSDPRRPGNSRILEIPMTILPIPERVGAALARLDEKAPFLSGAIAWAAERLFSLPAQPFWTGLNRLKAAVRLHGRRGGKVLSVFMHSSELAPGSSPISPTTERIEELVARLRAYLEWLVDDLGAQSVTMRELYEDYDRARRENKKTSP